MKQSRTAIKELTAAYRAVLKHAFIAMVGTVAVIGGASASALITVAENETKEITAGSELAGYEQAKDSGVAWVRGTLNVGSGTVFKDNKGEIGGAISIAKKVGVLNIADNVTFEGNTSIYDGGAIGNYGGAVISKNAVFRNNHANIGLDGSVITSDSQPIGGGAISMGVNGQLDIVSGLFDGNTSGYDGGAIGTRRTLQPGEKTEDGFANLGNYIKIADSTFVGNQATGLTSDVSNGQYAGGNGGAIANTFATTEISGTTFAKNTAAANGGAIYNHTFINADAQGTDTGLGGVMKITDSVFGENNAKGDGGAIKNTGTITISGNSSFIGNHSDGYGGAIQNGGNITISGAEFDSNTSEKFGGAIDNDKKLVVTDSKFINNRAENQYGGAISALWKESDTTIKNTIFANNYAKYAGAIYSGPTSVGLVLDNVLFTNNSATEIGALGAYSAGTKITNAKFYQNKALSDAADSDGGGAVFFGAETETVIDGAEFIENTSAARGGAMASRLAYWTNSGKIDILNSKFVGNVAATEGGVFDNSHHDSVGASGSVYMSGNTFAQNKAARGGVVYNRGLADKENKVGSITLADSNFVNNIATEQGGALFNEAGALMTLTGNNVFTGNMAGGVGNDIHNMGALTVAGGTTTIDGGITGNGTLTVADGATLNIGTATVDQGTLYLDGTVGLTIVDANNYGKLLANTYADDATTGRVSLTVATTGTYKIFNEGVNYTIVDAGAIYDVAQDDLGTGQVIISTKSVDKIAADTGLTDTAANTVAGLANSNNELANIASLNVQQALRDGDVDYVETETAKANPIDKPVVQSVAQSVQGAVMSLAANRMAGVPMAGRSGGDWSNADYGIWAQGMFNRSKFNGQFNGYTRGVAAGFDAQIAKQYTIGLGYAFGHSDVHANGGRNTEIDSNSVFAYAQYKPSNWYINGALNYTLSQYDEAVDAFGLHLTSDYDTNAFGAQVMTGYSFASGMTPEAGVRYLHVSQDSYNNGLTHVDSDDTDFLTGVAGLKYRFAIENGAAINWFPELRAAATYDFVSDRAMSTVTMPGAAAYVVDGDRLSRFGGEFGIGLTAEYNGLEISLTYDLDLHQDYTSQTGMAKFRYEF